MAIDPATLISPMLRPLAPAGTLAPLPDGYAPTISGALVPVRTNPAGQMVAADVDPSVVLVSSLLVAASVAASAYHGVKRNRGSVGWGVWWGLMGGLFPIITPAVAIAQGFGQPTR